MIFNGLQLSSATSFMKIQWKLFDLGSGNISLDASPPVRCRWSHNTSRSQICRASSVILHWIKHFKIFLNMDYLAQIPIKCLNSEYQFSMYILNIELIKGNNLRANLTKVDFQSNVPLSNCIDYNLNQKSVYRPSCYMYILVNSLCTQKYTVALTLCALFKTNFNKYSLFSR